MSCPATATATASRGTPLSLLPHLPHSASRKAENCKDLEVRGSTSEDLRRSNNAKRPATSVDGAVLPRMSPEELRRPATEAQNLKTDELMELIGTKMQANKFLSLRQAFRAFDPRGHGTITKEAFYRILCNTLAGITQRQYSALLNRMNLSDMKLISFEDFYSKFHKTDPHLRKKTLCPPHHITTADAHKTKVKDSSSSLPLPRLIHTTHNSEVVSAVTKQEFRSVLKSLDIELPDSELESAWRRYKQLDKGSVPMSQLSKELGFTGGGDGGKHSSISKVGEVRSPEIEKVENELNKNLTSLLQALRACDTLNCGMITAEKLRDVLTTVGVRITPYHMTELLQRAGVKDGCLVDYKSFMDRFTSRSRDGLAHSLVSDPHKGFRESKDGRACTSADEAEFQIVCHLHNKFLGLLGSFQTHDPKNCGYVTRDDFIKCIHDHIGDNSMDTQISRLMEQLCPKDGTWVPYSKFLAMFENGKPQEKKLHVELELHDAVDIKKLEEDIRDLVWNRPHQFLESFNALDTNNTGRMTLPVMNNVLMRHEIRATKQELQALWAKLVKNKDGTVNYHEFIRNLGQQRNPKTTTKPLTEDHCFMRSKTLHRDEDMLLNALKAKMAANAPMLYNKFKTLDSHSSGRIPMAAMQLVLADLCPDVTPNALSALLEKFKLDGDLVHYETMMARVNPPTDVYRTGNDIRGLLTQRTGNIISATAPPPLLAQQPEYGLPGLKAELQKQMVSNWRSLRRLFSSMDQARTGNITTSELKAVLKQSGIALNSEQMFHLMQELDPKLSGKVNYHDFFNVILD